MLTTSSPDDFESVAVRSGLGAQPHLGFLFDRWVGIYRLKQRRAKRLRASAGRSIPALYASASLQVHVRALRPNHLCGLLQAGHPAAVRSIDARGLPGQHYSGSLIRFGCTHERETNGRYRHAHRRARHDQRRYRY